MKEVIFGGVLACNKQHIVIEMFALIMTAKTAVVRAYYSILVDKRTISIVLQYFLHVFV